MFKVEEKATAVAGQVLLAIQRPRRGHADLVDEFRRAAASMALNTAEGCRRVGADRRQFLRVASGSAAEASVALKLLRVVGVVPAEQAAAIEAGLDEVRAMLYGLGRR
ncbi:MAG: four helix bundle protein [Deltaproteobacteria bacterium]|nr:four helix bundle protein [Deltaproteobacteria bacterium]